VRLQSTASMETPAAALRSDALGGGPDPSKPAPLSANARPPPPPPPPKAGPLPPPLLLVISLKTPLERPSRGSVQQGKTQDDHQIQEKLRKS